MERVDMRVIGRGLVWKCIGIDRVQRTRWPRDWEVVVVVVFGDGDGVGGGSLNTFAWSLLRIILVQKPLYRYKLNSNGVRLFSDRQTVIQTDRQTDRYTHTCTHTSAHTHRHTSARALAYTDNPDIFWPRRSQYIQSMEITECKK